MSISGFGVDPTLDVDDFEVQLRSQGSSSKIASRRLFGSCVICIEENIRKKVKGAIKGRWLKTSKSCICQGFSIVFWVYVCLHLGYVHWSNNKCKDSEKSNKRISRNDRFASRVIFKFIPLHFSIGCTS